MDTEMLHAQFLQLSVAFKELVFSKAVFGVAGVVHDSVAHGEDTAGIIAAAHGLRQLSVQDLRDKGNVGNIIQVDDGTQFCRVGILFRRRLIGREHDMFPGRANRFGQHQLGHGGTVKAEIIVPEKVHDGGIGRRLYRKVFSESFIPREGFLDCFRVGTDSRLIVDVPGSRINGRQLFCFFFADKGYFVHSIPFLYCPVMNRGSQAVH